MGTKTKKYTMQAGEYAFKLRRHGYVVRFNWVDESTYEDITIVGYGEFPTPREAYNKLIKREIV